MKTTHLVTALVLFLVVSSNAQKSVIGTYSGFVHHDTINREVNLTLESDSSFTLCVKGDRKYPYQLTSQGNWRSEGGWIYFSLNDEFVLYNTRGRDKENRRERMEYDLFDCALMITESKDQPDRIYFRIESYDPDFVSDEHYLEKR